MMPDFIMIKGMKFTVSRKLTKPKLPRMVGYNVYFLDIWVARSINNPKSKFDPSGIHNNTIVEMNILKLAR